MEGDLSSFADMIRVVDARTLQEDVARKDMPKKHLERARHSSVQNLHQDALKAAEHGNSVVLAAYLHAGGDPHALSRLHHMGWSLLHLAAGCSLMGTVTS